MMPDGSNIEIRLYYHYISMFTYISFVKEIIVSETFSE
jgi:hypothetical protein